MLQEFKIETSFKAITITALLNSIYQEMFQPEGTILIAQKTWHDPVAKH